MRGNDADVVFSLLQELLTRSFGILKLKIERNSTKFLLDSGLVVDPKFMPIWNLCGDLISLRQFLVSKDEQKYFHCEWIPTAAFLYYTGRPNDYVTKRGETCLPSAPAKYEEAARILWLYIYNAYVHHGNVLILHIDEHPEAAHDKHAKALLQRLRNDMQTKKWRFQQGPNSEYDDETKQTDFFLKIISRYPAQRNDFKAQLKRFIGDFSTEARPLKTNLKFSFMATQHKQIRHDPSQAVRDHDDPTPSADSHINASAQDLSQVVPDHDDPTPSSALTSHIGDYVHEAIADDITNDVQTYNMSTDEKASLLSFLTNRPHFNGVRSLVANSLKVPALQALDDLLCHCLMVQTTVEEIQAFSKSIQHFRSKYEQKSFPQKAKNLLSKHGFILEDVTKLKETRSSMFQALRTTDAWEKAIKRYHWLLTCQINSLSPRKPKDFGHQADCALLNWILKANHIPAVTKDVKGDGNCFLYSTYGALLDAVDKKENANNTIFAKTLRWLIIVHAEQFCGKAVIEDIEAKLIQECITTDTPEAFVNDGYFCDPHAFMPRMCLLFQMNMRVFSANLRKIKGRRDEWHLECERYTFRSSAWSDWVSKTSLIGKIPFLEWDPVEDAESIEAFQTIGGVWNFVIYSKVEFDGKTLAYGRKVAAKGQEMPMADLSKVVPMLLGKCDDDAQTDDQIIIALVSCGPDGHFCCLRGQGVQSLHPSRCATMWDNITKMMNTWTAWNAEATQLAAEVAKYEKRTEAAAKKNEKRVALEAKKRKISQLDEEYEAVCALQTLGQQGKGLEGLKPSQTETDFLTNMRSRGMGILQAFSCAQSNGESAHERVPSTTMSDTI